MKLKLKQLFEAPTDNSGSEENNTPKAPEKKEPEDKKESQKKDDEKKEQTEEEKLKLQIAAEKKAREAAEKKLKEKELENLSDDEKKKVQDEESKNQLLKGHEDLQLERLGLDESYRSLIHGSTPNEIKQKAEALSKVINTTKVNTESEVKKNVSKTITPGGAGDSDNDGEMDSVDFFTNILGGKI
ncbi:MAG: hypothetical protein ACPKNR_13240 [Pleomorphochaeta sp.]